MTSWIGVASVSLALLALSSGAKAGSTDLAACRDGARAAGDVVAACTAFLSREAEPAGRRASAHLCRARALTAAERGDGGAADYAKAIELSRGGHGLDPEATCVPGGDIALAVCGLDEFKSFGFVMEGCSLAISGGEARPAASLVAALKRRAVDRFDRGSRAEAIADLDRALALDPADIDGRDLRSRALYATNEFERAATDLAIVLRARPDDADAHQRLVHSSLLMGRLDAALASAHRVVELRPRAALSYLERARIYGIQGQVQPAIADLRQAGSLEAGYAEPRPYQLLVLERAIGALTHVIDLKLGPQTDALIRLRGQARERRGDLAGALADFDRAVELRRDDVVALAGRADIRMRRLDFPGGLADFRAALAIPDETAALQGAEAEAARENARAILAEFGTQQSAAVGRPKAMR